MPDKKQKKPQDTEEQAAEEHVRQLMEPHIPPPTRRSFTDVAAPKRHPEKIATTAPEVEVPVEDPEHPSSDEGIDELLSQPVGDLADDHAAETMADTDTDKAVDDITKHEGDAVLQAQDAAAKGAVVMKPKFRERIKNAFYSWWDNPVKRYVTLGVLAVVLMVVGTVPVVRALVLNTVGVRGTVQVTILDGTTTLPLKNVQLAVAGEQAITDSNGKATVRHVRLGKQQLSVSKLAFAAVTKTVTVGLGTTRVPDVSLKAVGTQFTFQLTNYVTGKPVAGAEVSSGQATARSDTQGKAILTVQPTDSASLAVQVAATGYRTEKLTIDATKREVVHPQMVSSKKEVFVSRQSGKYDVYTVDLDGKNRTVLLAATGNETQNISLSVNPDGTKAALVSTRDNQRDSQGYLLSTLTLLDVSGGAPVTVDRAAEINLLGWSGSRLVYREVVAGASAANPNRQRILSYDTVAAKRTQLAAANYFSGVAAAGSTVYYLVSATDPSVTATFSKIGFDGSGKQTIASQQFWSLVRTNYTTFALQDNTGWFTYTVGGGAPKTGAAPGSYASRSYIDAADGTKSLWADSRDGKGVLLTYDSKSGKDTTVTTQAGTVTALRWIDGDTAVYRLVTKTETADYTVSTAGGQPKKITDVTDVGGLTQTY